MTTVEKVFQTMKMMYNPETKQGRSCSGVHNLLGSNIPGADHALPMVRPKTKVSHCDTYFESLCHANQRPESKPSSENWSLKLTIRTEGQNVVLNKTRESSKNQQDNWDHPTVIKQASFTIVVASPQFYSYSSITDCSFARSIMNHNTPGSLYNSHYGSYQNNQSFNQDNYGNINYNHGDVYQSTPRPFFLTVPRPRLVSLFEVERYRYRVQSRFLKLDDTDTESSLVFLN